MLKPWLNLRSFVIRHCERKIPGSDTEESNFHHNQGHKLLRREGTLTCIDLVAASECLESLLQASIGDGRIPNIRAQHFELLTQDPINQSSWKPTAEVEKLCGRTVRVRGEAHMDKLFVAPIVALRITAGMVILKYPAVPTSI